MYLRSLLHYKPNLSDKELRAISGALLNELDISEPIPSEKFADITYEHEFQGLQTPQKKVIKMSKAEYIDDFFKNGNLQLGTFNYYKQFEDSEIGDKSEGSYLIIGQHKKITAFAEIGLEYDNNYLFCCFDGEPDSDTIQKFGYDDFFEILDIDGFSNAIKKTLKAREGFQSKCIYKTDKVIVGKTPDDFNFAKISPKLKNLVNEKKYFLKPIMYKHQSEFRFLWEVDNGVGGTKVINCPEAIKYCKRGK